MDTGMLLIDHGFVYFWYLKNNACCICFFNWFVLLRGPQGAVLLMLL